MIKTILLADDSITMQKVIRLTFASGGYEITTADNGDEAIRKAEETRPHLVLVDAALPGRSGYEVCEAIKKDPATSSIPVMLLAGTFEPLDKDEAERVKADDHIVKPFESQELIDKVNKLLSAGRAVSAQAPAQPEAGGEAEAFDISEDMWEEGDFLGFSEDSVPRPSRPRHPSPSRSRRPGRPAASPPSTSATRARTYSPPPRKSRARRPVRATSWTSSSLPTS